MPDDDIFDCDQKRWERDEYTPAEQREFTEEAKARVAEIHGVTPDQLAGDWWVEPPTLAARAAII